MLFVLSWLVSLRASGLNIHVHYYLYIVTLRSHSMATQTSKFLNGIHEFSEPVLARMVLFMDCQNLETYGRKNLYTHTLDLSI